MPRNIWVAVYDIHYPKIHKPTWDAILDFVGRNSGKIAGFLFSGDQLDNEEIGHWSAGKPLFRPTGSYKANTLGFNANVLSPIEVDRSSRRRSDWHWQPSLCVPLEASSGILLYIGSVWSSPYSAELHQGPTA